MPLIPYLTDAGELLSEAVASGKSLLFEAQLGALRDLDYGIYPYTSSSTPLAAYAPLGAGLPSLKVDRVVGVVKAYSTCVGEGPFVGELTGAAGDALRAEGQEYGAATGRPRRVGWLDMVATAYGVRLQGATELALTKLDVLDKLNEIPVCVAYELNGKRVERFPYTPLLAECKPIYDVLPGWREDIGNCRSFSELPRAARDYVSYIEKALEVPIRFISVGREREALIVR